MIQITASLLFNWLLFHISIISVYGMSGVQPTDWLSCMAKTLMLDILCKLNKQIFSYLPCLQAPLTSTILYHFQWPCDWRSQGQHKAKPLGFIFSCTFQLIGMKFDIVEFKVNIQIVFLSEVFWNTGNNYYFTDSVQKNVTLACIRRFINQFGSNSVWWYMLLNSKFVFTN